jgi:HK97 gp10 family phage protein
MASRIQVDGLRELKAAFDKLSLEMKNKVARQVTNAGAAVIRDLAVEKAPEAPADVSVDVPQRNLKNSIRTKGLKSNEAAADNMTAESIVFVRSGKKAFEASRYGAIQEYGSVKQSPQPFMRPAFDGGKSGAVNAMRDKLQAAINKANQPIKIKRSVGSKR